MARILLKYYLEVLAGRAVLNSLSSFVGMLNNGSSRSFDLRCAGSIPAVPSIFSGFGVIVARLSLKQHAVERNHHPRPLYRL